jgi:hypothetical protein
MEADPNIRILHYAASSNTKNDFAVEYSHRKTLKYKAIYSGKQIYINALEIWFLGRDSARLAKGEVEIVLQRSLGLRRQETKGN